MEDTTITLSTPPDDAGRVETSLLVVIGERAVTYPIRGAGHVSIGRGGECEVHIDDASISRRHAVLRVGGILTIEDAGSSNGTWLRGVRLEPGAAALLAPGEPVQLGAAMLLVQRAAAATPAPPRRAPDDGDAGEAVAGASLARMMPMIERLAAGRIAVLITGETGVGKGVLARLLHERSPRAAGPFVAASCAAIPEALFESELFGHERGAFSGAVTAKPGRIEAASGGTLFLDEIGELPLAQQAKLLRVLEDGHVLRVGGVAPRPIDVRFLAATNRDLRAEVEAGRFRRDLYFRIGGATLAVPALRDRPEDVEALAAAFLRRFATEPVPRLTSGAVDALRAHPWPGNVRELRNVIERAVLLGRDPIEAEDLALEPPSRRSDAVASPRRPAIRDEVAELERSRIEQALAACAGNQTRAAEMLGMSRRTLTSKLSLYGFDRPRKR